MPQAQVLIWSLTFLATPGLLLPIKFARANLRGDAGSATMIHGLLVMRLFFITLTMTAIGLVALVIWDAVYPDRRDAKILSGLPLPGHVLIGARLLALSAVCAVFVAGINAVPAVTYAPLIAVFGGAANLPQGIIAFALANACAGMFVFTTLVALQGFVLNLGGRRAADRMSLALQALFVMALLQMIFFLPRVGALLGADLSTGAIRAMPSIWFLALYDVLGGRPVAGAGALAAVALAATATSTGLAVLLLVSTNARLTKRALESHDAPAGSRSAGSAVKRITGIICRRPQARAAFAFTLQTLARSRSHRLLLSLYIGGALALVGSAVVPIAIRNGMAGFATPGVVLLSAPLVIGFFALVGTRVALAIPVEPKAGWIFRLREPPERAAVMDGVQAAMLVAGVLPMTLIALLSAGVLWGARLALVHAGICLLMGWLLVEILLIGVAKIPFTCTYLPGRSRFGTLWPLYLTGFGTYCYTVAAWEAAFLTNARAVVIFIALIGTATATLMILREHRLARLQGFRFHEEDPTALFTGFELSEGLAARTSAQQMRP